MKTSSPRAVAPPRARRTGRPEAPKTEELQGLLRAAGLRSTGPRVAVLEYVHAHVGPNSHAELFRALGDKGFDRATIYRVLIDLSEVGILSRTDLGDHVWRFELRRGAGGIEHTEDHPHFVCVDCGEVSCLPGVSVRVQGARKGPRSVSKNKVAVQLSGLCDDCE